ncbi:protein translocase subunit secG [Hypnocyclicus thermotrophus]|uniref:Protein-export membrane protein SecG n=1 Tax=Hypnocyclicus thermotrophus TaxID=1627895 RepID=A0AA46DXP4_9FUSO|nr:preprotein translocase subunit SecG [Hypnocyclicus thermotrophus]TDT68577.1 protein translocase subunit secG [Hypnocyclicus thermotrophus]
MLLLFKITLFIISIFLIGLVLIQPDKSHGMSGSIGGGAVNTVFGVNEDGGPLAKATQIVAALFIINGLIVYLLTL